MFLPMDDQTCRSVLMMQDTRLLRRWLELLDMVIEDDDAARMVSQETGLYDLPLIRTRARLSYDRITVFLDSEVTIH